MTDPAKNDKPLDKPAADKGADKNPPRKGRAAKRETAAVDAEALYPLPPDKIDEKKVAVLAERAYGDQTVQVVTDGKSVWKEVG